MLIYILSRNAKLYSTARLIEAAEKKGWNVKVIDYLKCTIEIMKGELVVHYLGKILPVPDAIIPRIGASRTFYGTAMVRHFEMMDVFSTSGNLAIARSRDKLRSLQVLSKNDVDMPKTVFASNKSSAKDVIALSGGAPLVLKILEGTQGVGAVLVDSEKAAKAMGLGVCGVDMIPSARGPLVMEVNSSPGLEGIEKSTKTILQLK